MASVKRPPLNYNPKNLPREQKQYYISAGPEDLREMLMTLGPNNLEDLYTHIPSNVLMKEGDAPLERMGDELGYEALLDHVVELSLKNKPRLSFLGDGLADFALPAGLDEIPKLRGLTTAYTPYQPERGQGTLIGLWIYSSMVAQLTGFEAINASLYDRSTAIHEAMNTALRLMGKGKDTILVSRGIYPGDQEVLETLVLGTPLKIEWIPLDKSGLTDKLALKALMKKHSAELAGIVFPQVNCLGNLEDVHILTDLAQDQKVKSIAVVDPMLLGTGGLVPPSQFGREGAHMFVAEGQQLGLAPNFGGPGLGIFGIRYGEKNKNDLRSTAGRFVGNAFDQSGKNCKVMVLSTREQHIRREKATSNICSNQTFVAILAGAGVLLRGEEGMQRAHSSSREKALYFVSHLKGSKLAYPQTAFYNEVVIELPLTAKEAISLARQHNLHVGVDVSARTGNSHHLLISFFDRHQMSDVETLLTFLSTLGTSSEAAVTGASIPNELLRSSMVGLPNFSQEEVIAYYKKLSGLNVSPDENIYPLGSCTMKYNPYINDYAAGLPSFTDIHPQAPIEDAQGNLELLYQIQEMFKAITGLSAVTTQPVAGAQGELVGIKMFQAYHRDRGEGETRNVLLIPRSAHGTNPATATMAGYETKVVNGVPEGIITIEANSQGLIDMVQLQEMVTKYNKRIAGIMVTNPNTSGIFEKNFQEVAELVHSVGGLVYMDGANMNAIAGHVDLGKLGVDAVHNNLHKTWTIPHGGGGPGDAIVAVSDKLVDYLPGVQVQMQSGLYSVVRPQKSIGSFHRHYGNFAHKIRCYTYLKALGPKGVRKMSAVAVLSARYLYAKLKTSFPTLPIESRENPVMHEFIITLPPQLFAHLEKHGTPKATAIGRVGKLFLDFGIHAPTVSFPESLGLMIEPTESFSKFELDRFVSIVKAIGELLMNHPEILHTVPHFTPIARIDEVSANKNLQLSENLQELPTLYTDKVSPQKLLNLNVQEISKEILRAHLEAVERDKGEGSEISHGSAHSNL